MNLLRRVWDFLKNMRKPPQSGGGSIPEYKRRDSDQVSIFAAVSGGVVCVPKDWPWSDEYLKTVYGVVEVVRY